MAEAMLRVFHRLGDYKHSQRNRMKFLIQTMGWDAWRAEFDRALATTSAAEGAPPLPFDPCTRRWNRRPRVRPGPTAPREPRRRRGAGCARAASAGRAFDPHPGPGRARRSRDAGRTPTCVPRSRRATPSCSSPFRWGTSRRRSFACSPTWPSRTATGPSGRPWIRTWRCAGSDSAGAALYRLLAAAGLDLPGSGTSADVTSCPGAEACRLAVTQSRGLGRRHRRPPSQRRARPRRRSGRPQDEDQRLPERLRPAPHRGSRLPGQREARLGGRIAAAVLRDARGRRRRRRAAHFGRIAAKVPARRITEAVERLVALYRPEGEPAKKRPPSSAASTPR